MGTGPLGNKGGPGTQPATCQAGGIEAAAASRTGCSWSTPRSRRLGKLRGICLGGVDPSWGGDSRAVHIPLSMGLEAAEAKHRFPIKRVYLAPALLTLKQEGLKVNSLSIPYCQLIHHSTGAGAAQALLAPAPMGLEG